MKQKEFIGLLEKKLKDNNVGDIEEILEEYNDHFTYKLLDGYSEEEISKKLGDPAFIASQYDEKVETANTRNKFVTYTGLGISSFFVGIFLIILVAWIIVSVSTSLVTLTIGGVLLSGIQPFWWFPTMPYWAGAIFAITFLSLSVIMLLVTYYSYLYVIQVFKSYRRFHKNQVNEVNNRPTLPSVSSTPILTRRRSRQVRKIMQFSLSAFAVSFILAYVVLSISAGSLEYWHVYGWFQR